MADQTVTNYLSISRYRYRYVGTTFGLEHFCNTGTYFLENSDDLMYDNDTIWQIHYYFADFDLNPFYQPLYWLFPASQRLHSTMASGCFPATIKHRTLLLRGSKKSPKHDKNQEKTEVSQRIPDSILKKR